MNNALQVAGPIIFVGVALFAFSSILAILPDLMALAACAAILYFLYGRLREVGLVR